MHNHYFPRDWKTGEYFECACGLHPDNIDPDEEDYWRSLLDWVDAQR